MMKWNIIVNKHKSKIETTLAIHVSLLKLKSWVMVFIGILS